jgi:hypothetical protein
MTNIHDLTISFNNVTYKKIGAEDFLNVEYSVENETSTQELNELIEYQKQAHL